MESKESQFIEEFDLDDVAPKTIKRAHRVPRVAGERVPKELIIHWYDKLAKEGFKELESFNSHMYAREDVPIKNIWRQKIKQGVLRKIRSGEEEYWRAARLFYWDWSGWDLPAYKRFSLLRELWGEYLEGTTYWLMAKKFSKPGRTISGNTVTYYMLKLKQEFKRWAVQNNALPRYKPRKIGEDKNDRKKRSNN